MGNGKLAIAWTDWGAMCGETAFSIVRFISYDAAHRNLHAATIRASGAYVDDNHNNAVSEFLTATDAEWYLSLDADMVPRPEQFYHLLDVADAEQYPIVSGLYFGYVKTNLNTGGMAPVWMRKHSDGYRTLFDRDIQPLSNQLVEIDSSGMGFMLIHRSVFERMRAMENFQFMGWFGRQILAHDREITGRYGEDIAFCHRAQQCGFKIYGHPGVVIDHIKSRRENLETFCERVLGRAALERNREPKQTNDALQAAAG